MSEARHPWGATPDDDTCDLCWHGDGDARCIVCGRSTSGEWTCDCDDGPTIGPCVALLKEQWRERCHRCGAKWAGPTTPLPTDSLGRKVCPAFDSANCQARTTADRGLRNDLSMFAEEFTEVLGVGCTVVPDDTSSQGERRWQLDVPADHPARSGGVCEPLPPVAWHHYHEAKPDPRPGRPGFWHNVIAHPLLVVWPRLGEWLHERTTP